MWDQSLLTCRGLNLEQSLPEAGESSTFVSPCLHALFEKEILEKQT